MSVQSLLKTLKKRGVKLTIAKIPVGRRPMPMEHRVHEAFERELLIKFLARLHAWFDVARAQDFENLNRSEVEQLVQELCARKDELKKYRS